MRRMVQDFSYWTQTWAAGFTALNGEPAYEDPAIRTADGVFVWDAEYCCLAEGSHVNSRLRPGCGGEVPCGLWLFTLVKWGSTVSWLALDVLG